VGGHIYGIPATGVRQLAAAGRLVVIDLDKVAHAVQLRKTGFKVSRTKH
jgi:hypothetical protein